MKLIGGYKNGNYNCLIYNDGTKVRYNDKDNFIAEFPESIDIKISNKCDKLCPMCHENSEPNGALAPLNHPLLSSLRPYTELALGGGNIMTHPDLIPFLIRMRHQGIICNITLHIDHFIENFDLLDDLVQAELIHGIGISVSRPITSTESVIFKCFPNLVIHVIAGMVNKDIFKSLEKGNFKLLILGYKEYGRGKDYSQKVGPIIERNLIELENDLEYLKDTFDVVSFDNLALKQLHMDKHVSKEIWDKCYMGDDGAFTMYVDLVEQTYAVSSISERHPIDSNKIEVLFKKLKNDKKGIE